MSDSPPANYNAVPPPDSLNAAPVDIAAAVAKAKAIAAKLQQQKAIEGTSTSTAPVISQGVKRSYDYDEDEENIRESNLRNEDKNGSYEDSYDRETKRNAYDLGSSRPSYPSNNDSRRYGLGSEERKSLSATSSYSLTTSTYGTTQQEFTVPNPYVGLIIGRGGENLRVIERETGARVQFSQDQGTGDPERRVTVSGPPEAVKAARERVLAALDDARSSDRGTSNTMIIHIPNSKVGLVIGRGGETIRDLQERSGAKIMVTHDDKSGAMSERPVNLIGDETAINRAKALIDEIVNGSVDDRVVPSRDWSKYRQQYAAVFENEDGYGTRGRFDRDRGGFTGGDRGSDRGSDRGEGFGRGPPRRHDEESETIQVPNDSVGFIIGRGGETVRMLQDQSGAKIKVEPSNGPTGSDRTVNIFGNAEAIARAKELIHEKIAGGRDRVPRGERSGSTSGSGYSSGQGGGYGGAYGQGSGGYGSTASNSYGNQQGYGQYGQGDYAQYGSYQSYSGYQGYEGAPGTSSSGTSSTTVPGAPGTATGSSYYQQPYYSGGYYSQYSSATTSAPAAPGTTSSSSAPPPPGTTGSDTSSSTGAATASSSSTQDYSAQWEEYFKKYPEARAQYMSQGYSYGQTNYNQQGYGYSAAATDNTTTSVTTAAPGTEPEK